MTHNQHLMGILPGGPNSGFSGKAGSYVGYYRMGKWIIRGLPRLSPKNKIGSADQNLHRSRFTQIQHFLKPIIPFIQMGFNLEAKRRGNTAHNSATSWNLLNAFNENDELDYAKTRVSLGLLPGAEEASARFEDGKIIFTWRDNSVHTQSSGIVVPRTNDTVMLLALNTEETWVEMTRSGAPRSAGIDSLTLPDYPNTQWHTWIAFISDDRVKISNSEYLGRVTIG